MVIVLVNDYEELNNSKICGASHLVVSEDVPPIQRHTEKCHTEEWKFSI